VPLFTAIAVLVSFLGAGISKKILRTGDEISSRIVRIIYYWVLLIVLIVVPNLFYSLIVYLSDYFLFL